MIEFTLPFPPSTNGLFANRKGGRHKTSAYTSWIREAGWEMHRQRVRPFKVPVALEIELTAPDKRARDASNYIKGIEDLLVRCGILADDNSKHIRGVTARWIEGDSRPGAKVRITPV